jgi:hypothetical protein
VFVLAEHHGPAWRTNAAALPHRFGMTATAQNLLPNN